MPLLATSTGANVCILPAGKLCAVAGSGFSNFFDHRFFARSKAGESVISLGVAGIGLVMAGNLNPGTGADSIFQLDIGHPRSCRSTRGRDGMIWRDNGNGREVGSRSRVCGIRNRGKAIGRGLKSRKGIGIISFKSFFTSSWRICLNFDLVMRIL